MKSAKQQCHLNHTIESGVTLILEAGENINTEIEDLRSSLSAFKHEFIVIDRGTEHRRWLAEQNDVLLIAVHDGRDVLDLAHKMAGNEARLIKDGDTWRFEARKVHQPPLPGHKATVKTKKASGPSHRRRILHVSSFPDNTAGITDALKQLGDVRTFDWLARKKAVGVHDMNDELVLECLQFEPDVIFMEETFTGDIFPQTIVKIKSNLKVGVVDWCGDIRAEIPQSMINMSDAVDWVMLSNKPQVVQLRRMGKRAEFLPSGCATNIYKPTKPNREKYPADIIFLGSGGRHYPNSELREKMVIGLHERYGDRFAVYGRGWNKRKYPFVKPFIEPIEEEPVAYSSCKIAVGINAFKWDGYTSARMWKAMGSGAFYVTHYFPGIGDWFTRSEDIEWWNTLNELFSIIDYYLKRDDERRRVARNGCAKVRAQHSWLSRMEDMLRIVSGSSIKEF